MKKKKAFTLIELIAILVILAILALIVTPLVMNIIKKAKIAKDKRSIDGYGKAVELAIATYLLDVGRMPTDISQLNVEYSGERVECEVFVIKRDKSVFLDECSVGGRSIDYAYGIGFKEYTVGQLVNYNGIDFYVIKNSGVLDDAVTLLKAEPLTVSEVNEYGEGHVNTYAYCTGGCQEGAATNQNGYGKLAYYTSSSCRYSWSTSECINDYDLSDIKYVVDGWAQTELTESDLKVDSTGYSSRLLMYDELENLGYVWGATSPSDIGLIKSANTPSFVYNSDYSYWTMIAVDDAVGSVRVIASSGDAYGNAVCDGAYGGVVRPVINLKKHAIKES